MDTWIEVAGLTIHSPVTAFTNLLLCVQCTVYYRAVRTGHKDRAGYWSLFFFAMAVATLAGVSKHGLSHVLSADVYLAVLWASSLGTAASVYFAQRATIISRVGPRWASRLVGLAALQLAIFLGANLILGPEMLLIVAHTAVGLIPVIVVEALSLRTGEREGAWIAGGLVLSMLTGVVYVARLGFGPWLNHIDIAHLLMGVSFALMVRGARSGAVARPGDSWLPSRRPEFVGGLVARRESI
jgi:hypothetical protein